MKKLRITIGDQSYEVTVEVLEDSDSSASRHGHARPIPSSVPTPVATPAASPAHPPQASNSGSVFSPMSGSVMSVNVKQGDAVQPGAVLLVLDAMKMENKVTAPKAGVVNQALVKEGDTVTEGQLLFVIE